MAISSFTSYPVTSLAIGYVLYLLGLVVYRLYFHPLARFPGPKYAAISRWHEFYYEVVKQGQFTFKIQDYHQKYGAFPFLEYDSTDMKLTQIRSYRPHCPR